MQDFFVSDDDDEEEIKEDARIAEISSLLFIALIRERSATSSRKNDQSSYLIVALDHGEEDEMFVKSMQKLSYRLQNELKVPASRITERVLKIFPSHSSIVLLSTVVAKCVNYLIFVGPWNTFIGSNLIIFDAESTSKTYSLPDFADRFVVSGGLFLSLQTSPINLNYLAQFPNFYFCETIKDFISSTLQLQPVAMRKRNIACNSLGAPYWTQSWQQDELAREQAIVDSLTVSVSRDEMLTGVLRAASREKALSSLREHGLCIFSGLFDPSQVLLWGSAAKADMEAVVHKLWESRGVDLLHPYDDLTEPASDGNVASDSTSSASSSSGYGKYLENFHEVSMREALRCDLRNGRAVTAKNQELYGASAASGYGDAAALTELLKNLSDANRIPSSSNIRYHPVVLDIVQEVMNVPDSPSRGSLPLEDHSAGNWG